MTGLTLVAWLHHYESRPHPHARRCSHLGDRELWRLAAVRSGRVPEVDPTDLEGTAVFVEVSADLLADHDSRCTGAVGGALRADPDPEVARRWLARRAELAAAHSLLPVDGELDAYESEVRALLDKIALQLLTAADALEGVSPALLADTTQPSQSEDALAGEVERGLAAVHDAQATLTALRKRLVL